MAEYTKVADISETSPRVSELRRFFRVFFGRKIMIFCTVVILLFLILAAFGPWISPYEPLQFREWNYPYARWRHFRCSNMPLKAYQSDEMLALRRLIHQVVGRPFIPTCQALNLHRDGITSFPNYNNVHTLPITQGQIRADTATVQT